LGVVVAVLVALSVLALELFRVLVAVVVVQQFLILLG
jgi:hypothetical protein